MRRQPSPLDLARERTPRSFRSKALDWLLLGLVALRWYVIALFVVVIVIGWYQHGWLGGD